MTEKKSHVERETEVLTLATQFYVIKNTPRQEQFNLLIPIVSFLWLY